MHPSSDTRELTGTARGASANLRLATHRHTLKTFARMMSWNSGASLVKTFTLAGLAILLSMNALAAKNPAARPAEQAPHAAQAVQVRPSPRPLSPGRQRVHNVPTL